MSFEKLFYYFAIVLLFAFPMGCDEEIDPENRHQVMAADPEDLHKDEQIKEGDKGTFNMRGEDLSEPLRQEFLKMKLDSNVPHREEHHRVPGLKIVLPVPKCFVTTLVEEWSGHLLFRQADCCEKQWSKLLYCHTKVGTCDLGNSDFCCPDGFACDNALWFECSQE